MAASVGEGVAVGFGAAVAVDVGTGVCVGSWVGVVVGVSTVVWVGTGVCDGEAGAGVAVGSGVGVAVETDSALIPKLASDGSSTALVASGSPSLLCRFAIGCKGVTSEPSSEAATEEALDVVSKPELSEVSAPSSIALGTISVVGSADVPSARPSPVDVVSMTAPMRNRAAAVTVSAASMCRLCRRLKGPAGSPSYERLAGR